MHSRHRSELSVCQIYVLAVEPKLVQTIDFASLLGSPARPSGAHINLAGLALADFASLLHLPKDAGS